MNNFVVCFAPAVPVAAANDDDDNDYNKCNTFEYGYHHALLFWHKLR